MTIRTANNTFFAIPRFLAYWLVCVERRHGETGFEFARNSPECCTSYSLKNPTCLTFPNNLPALCEMWKRFVRVSCCRYSIAACRAITSHFPAICLSKASGVPRLGPGIHVKILLRVGSSGRLGLLVSSLYSDGEERHVLMKASRNTGAALPLYVLWRARIVVGSFVTHAV